MDEELNKELVDDYLLVIKAYEDMFEIMENENSEVDYKERYSQLIEKPFPRSTSSREKYIFELRELYAAMVTDFVVERAIRNIRK